MSHPSVYVRKIKPVLTHACIPAIVLILAGMIDMTKSLPLGLLLITLALFALTLTEGLEIDFTHSRIRIFLGLFGLRFGKWETLPAIERITVVPINLKHSMMHHIYLTTEVSVSYVQVRLYPHNSKDYYIASIGKLSSAQSDAQLLANQFVIPYEDFTL